MLMPEASIHEHCNTAGWENNIRMTRQVPAMEPEAQPSRM
jgi:hypothetical protein